jgi:hypothetical protein
VAVSGTREVTLTWSSLPGRRYQVQYAGDPFGPWSDSQEAVEASDVTTTWRDPAPAFEGQRFYRVLLEP